MCGRFVQKDVAAVERHFAIKRSPGWRPSFNVAPGQLAAIVRRDKDAGAAVLDEGRWGFIPAWASGAARWPKPINARIETVFDKPAWRAAIKRSRCLVPADGWYEWQATDRGKRPYFLGATTPTAIAGLYDHHRENGRNVLTFALLVRAAPAVLADIHDRAPVLLTPDQWDTWLDPELTAREQIAAAIERPAPAMRLWPVDTRVNKPANNDSDLILPVSV